MSHDQRPARVKVVGVTGAVARPDAASAAPNGATRASDGVAAAPAAAQRSSALLLSILFILGSIIGGIGLAVGPALIAGQ